MATDGILTTHTGSLPRPEALLRQMRNHPEHLGHLGHTEDAAHEALVSQAVAVCVDRQIAAGIDIVNDGEQSRPSYATYVKDRLTGFGGQGAPPNPADVAEYPEFAKRLLGEHALRALETPACDAPVRYRDTRAVEQDIARLHVALRGRADGFMTAASPGVISLFLQNHHYPSRESYLGALADAMRTEYRAIHASGLVLQVDCPDLAMSGHMADYAGMTLKELRRQLALHVEVLNHAVRDIPADQMRMHVCWGNYEGPHHRDVPLRDIIDIWLSARPAGISFCASNPRHAHEWKIWSEIHVPDDKILIPGVIDSTTNFIEHPELVAERLLRFERIVGRERVIAGTDCGFSTFAGLLTVDPSICWAKLEAMSAGARLASGALRQAPRPVVVPAS
jgi:5-methyltetrahydropteroyltriglutamate--homocysteine methyltransferase